jgi:hypothetical protein
MDLVVKRLIISALRDSFNILIKAKPKIYGNMNPKHTKTELEYKENRYETHHGKTDHDTAFRKTLQVIGGSEFAIGKLSK